MQTIKHPIDTLKTAEQFHAFFSAIPEKRWCCAAFDGDTSCALGHIARANDTFSLWSDDDDGAPEKLMRIIGPIASINDGKHPDYQQPTPKARILAALKDKFSQP